jgi:hypothetical protein
MLYSPCSPVLVFRTWPVAWLTACTSAPRITPPAESRTTPVIVPSGDYARQTPGGRMHGMLAATRGFTVTLETERHSLLCNSNSESGRISYSLNFVTASQVAISH